MVDIQKWIFALALSFVFVGLASAQPGLLACNVATGAPPELRGEGYTELVGDIFVTCSGGAEVPPGSTATFTVYMPVTVTSRLLSSSSVAGQTPSEALLLINDPAPAAQSFCASPFNGAGPGGCTYTSQNVYEGVSSGQTVTFYGIPVVLPSVTGLAQTTYRITNVRINANALNSTTFTTVTAAVSVSGPISLNSALTTVGYVVPSLNTSQTKAYSTSNSGLSSSTALGQCQAYPASGSTPVALETLTFTEVAGSAFRPRGSTSQNGPGNIYITESGLTVGAATGSSPGGATLTAGYADWGTRLKAVFNNIPAGTRLYVSTTNLNSSYNAPMGTVATAGSLTGSSFAQLITSETAPDTGPSAPLVNNFIPWAPVVSQAGAATSSVTGATAASPIGYAPLTIVNGSASAVWEVMNSLANTTETFAFEVFIVQAANTPPVPATMTVNMSYAPIPTQGAFTIASGAAASNTLSVPRFFDNSTPLIAATIPICSTGSVPALSPWALAVLTILLLAIGAQIARKRHIEH